jgi:isopentenyl-diphosphate delta-isomerase
VIDEHVILVDADDVEIGTLEKLAAHRKGALHRAISVFLYNSKGQMLIQRRAKDKYHSSGLWTNSCCSHPRPGEDSADAAQRRLVEEMGISANLTHVYSFTYKTEFDNGLTENEFDHVYVGVSDQQPHPNEQEVMEWRYVRTDDVRKEIQEQPGKFTSWFKLCFEEVVIKTEQIEKYG